MSQTVISVENLSKSYQLGVIGTGTFYGDVKRWWAKQRGKPDPYLKVGEADHGNRDGETIWALKDVNFSVQQGEALGIIGRNGAGKSTLLKIFSQVTSPTSGVVKIKGRIASLLEVGTGFHPELTGRENIHLNCAIMGMNRDEISRKFDEIVDFSGVERFIDTPVKRYSSGMYVRLAFAVAAHLEPEILVVDEVLAVGDVQFQKKCLGKMQAVGNEGRTVLFVSHNMASIRKLCSRVILLQEGRIAADGTTDRIIGQYLGQDASGLSPSIALSSAGYKSPMASLNLDADKEELLGVGTYLHFCSEIGEPKALFRQDESWRIVLDFEIFKYVQHCIAAIGLMTLEQIPLATYWSQPQNLHAGKYVVEFDVNLPLKACELQFTVGLSTYERSFYYRENIGHVSIAEVTVSEQPIRARGAGLLRTPQTAVIKAQG